MGGQYTSKVVYGSTVLIDLTADTVVADKLLSGFTAHGADGAPVTGACTFDVDSSDATAQVAEVLTGKTFYARGAKMTGTMPNNGAVDLKITTKAQEVAVAQGYHDGSGKVSIDADEQAKIIAANIRQGVTILGVEGTMSGTEDVNAQTVSVTPSLTAQTILPTGDYNYLAQVNVAAIPYAEVENAAGGVTVTIGAVSGD